MEVNILGLIATTLIILVHTFTYNIRKKLSAKVIN